VSFALRLYAAAASVAYPFIEGWLRRRHAEGFDERRAIYAGDKLEKLKKGSTLWLHAVSVGEVQATSPVVDEIAWLGRDVPILLSTVTETGARSARLLMGGKIAAHVYAPWDVPKITKKACRSVMPAVYATAETEVWPNLLTEMKRMGIPTLLINARISDRTMARAGLAKGLLKEAYGLFDAILARSDEDRSRLIELGAAKSRITVTGDTKADALMRRKAIAERGLPRLREKILPSGGICFVAGSTHEGEEETVLDAFSRLRGGNGPINDAKLVVAPRHPERALAVRGKAREICPAEKTELYSDLNGQNDASIIVVDAIGVLFDLYGLATAAFIGGSLVPKGGQNILEPAIWGTPVLHGPHMEDFALPASELNASGASFTVKTSEEMESLWRRAAKGLLPSPDYTGGYFAANLGAAARTAEAILSYAGVSARIQRPSSERRA
jgi:3-deoxy-D-manno-octulosonic-acid transferase